MAWAIARGRIGYRLLLVNLLVVAVPLAGVTLARMHERQLLAAMERDLIHQAAMLAEIAADGPVTAARVRAFARDTRSRLMVVDASGRVVADSAGQRGADVSDRPEIARALAGRYGAATRTTTDGYDTRMYVAMPVRRGGEVVGAVYVVRSTELVKAQLHRLRRWLLRVGIASIGLTAVLTLFLAWTIARPLGRLTRVAERIAAGERVEGLALRRSDEIGQLARAVDRMHRELERRASDLRVLAADISHEFRSPLTGIRGAAELLRDGAADDPEARERFLAMILDDAARLDRVVTRLLELSRAESGGGAIEPVDLAALAREVAAAHTAPVLVDAPPRAVVPGRVAGLTAAVDNLVLNAVQHATPGTAIAIAVERRGSGRARRTRVAVRNEGAPLDAAVRARVWDRFFTTRAQVGGTGLGLAIVRSVAATHGGTCGCEADAGGNTFWFEV